MDELDFIANFNATHDISYKTGGRVLIFFSQATANQQTFPAEFFDTPTPSARNRSLDGIQIGVLFEQAGSVQIELIGASFKTDILDELFVDITFTNLEDGSQQTLSLTGIGGGEDTANPYDWQPSNTDEVTAFENWFPDGIPANVSGTIRFYNQQPVVIAKAGIASGTSAIGAKTEYIEPGEIETPAYIPVSGSSVDSKTDVLEAKGFTKSGIAVSGSALATKTLKTHATPAGIAVSGSTIGINKRILKQHNVPANISLSGSSVDSKVDKITPAVKPTRSGTASSATSLQSRTRRLELTAPQVITNIFLLETGQEYVVLDWDPPIDDGLSGVEPVIRYEIQFENGGWVSTGSNFPGYRLTQIGSVSIQAGREYRIRLRAVNAIGNGDASDIFNFSSGEIILPSIVRFPQFYPNTKTSLRLTWLPPVSLGGGTITNYEISLIFPDGTIGSWEPTDDNNTEFIIKGLVEGLVYGARIRAINQTGPSPATQFVSSPVIEKPTEIVSTPVGRIPLLPNALRQSLILRLDNVDLRLKIWWQPIDLAWYFSVEIPVNTFVIQSRRITVNSGFLDLADSPIMTNIVCRALDSAIDRLEPGVDAWNLPSHALFLE